MRHRFAVLLAATPLLGLALLALLAGPAPAAVQACNTTDISDATGDVAQDPADADALTGFAQLDLQGLCVAETADTTHLVLTVGASVSTNAAQDFTWEVHLQADGAAKVYRLRSTAGTNTFTPANSGEVSAAKIQFNLAKADAAPGARLDDFFLASSGTFVPAAGDIVTGTDRAPDAQGSTSPFAYTVGQRAPPGTDTDGDGAEDSEEVADGTNPSKPDTDDDGLLDGADLTVPAGDARQAEFQALGIFQRGGAFAGEKSVGTNGTNPDTDADGLIDGGNATLPEGSDRAESLARTVPPILLSSGQLFPGELSFETSPTIADSDGDGILDGNEVHGGQNTRYADRGYLAEIPGSTNPARADTDGDLLSDGDEIAGQAVIDGTTRNFSPTDPNNADTDGDGLSDREEVVGRLVVPSTRETITFPPTDPTNRDSDGDGFDDYQEVVGESDPEDPNKVPTTAGPGSEIAYLLISALAMLVVVFVSVAGILWRWA